MDRPFLERIDSAEFPFIQKALELEQERERKADAEYWSPLKRELEKLRWNR